MATPSGTSASDTVSAHEQSPKFRTVVLHPIISEKATLAESQGIYTFAVSNSATKIDVKFAIKQQYGILPKRVSMLNAIKQQYGILPKRVSMLCMEGKRLRFGRNRGKRSDWKKAVVSLPKGKTIHIHEGV